MPRSADAARDLREDCLIEAAAIIAERGVEALSLREVARRLGVSHQAPYKHFESRDHILAELTVRALRSFFGKLEGRRRRDDPFEDLEAIGRAYFDYAADDPLSYQLMFGTPLIDPAAYPELAEAGRRSFEVLLRAIERLPRHAADGDSSGAELDALFAWSAVHGVVSLLHSHAMKVQGIAPEVMDHLQSRTLDGIAKALGRP